MNLLQKFKSVRSILTLWYTFVLLLAFVIFSVSVYVYLAHLLEQRLDGSLINDVEWITRFLQVESSNGATANSQEVQDVIARHFSLNSENFVVLLTTADRNTIVYESDNRLGRVLLQTEVPPGETVVETISDTHSGFLRVAAHRMSRYLIQVAYTRDVIDQVLEHLLSIFAILGPVVLFVSVSGGWLLAGMVLKPIRDISHITKRITAQNLGERIPDRTVTDELGELIGTINQTIARLEASFDDIRQFSMNVAHELKTPLTIMKGESELALAKELSKEEMQSLILSTLEEATRMSRIVDDLLTLAKADAGQVVIEHRSVPLQRMIQDLYEDALILAEQKGLTVKLGNNDDASVNGDEARLRQLFRALLSNAVQYTDAGGTIRIDHTAAENETRVCVEDTGIGMEPGQLEKIFQRFYRVDQARTRLKGGSGLGLSIAKWIAESHNGRITVTSAPGRGSCFTVHLPRA